MKTKILTLMILVLAFTLLPISMSFAQEEDQSNVIGLFGLNYDEDPVFTAGVGVNIPGTKLWQITYVKVGNYSEINFETALLFGNDKYFIGPMAGPNVDWQEPNSNIETITYITGAGGLIAGIKFSQGFGLSAYGKYKFDFKDH